jgi:hypothetical protein
MEYFVSEQERHPRKEILRTTMITNTSMLVIRIGCCVLLQNQSYLLLVVQVLLLAATVVATGGA